MSNAREFPSADLAALARLLRVHGIESDTLHMTPLSGGQSNPTFRIGGADRPLVLRTKPQGALLVSAHAIDREHRVMAALAATDVPVPRTYFYADDMSVLSTPFYVMQFLDGRTFEDQTLPGMTPTDRRAIYGEMVATIAKLHRLDYGRLGLGDFGRPGNYVARQIARWTKGYRESETMRIPAMDALIDWLPRHVPALETTRLVHGDFRLDNLILAPDGPRIIGVIDWELATLGNPIADFAYHCMSWHIPPDIWRGIKGHDLAALGIPAEADYVGLYAQALGFDVLPDWNFYLSYNFFRIAAILQGIAKRAEVGSATADNAIETGRKAAPLAEIGMRLAGIA